MQGTKGRAKKEEIFRGGGYVHDLDCGDILYVKSDKTDQIVHCKHMQFIVNYASIKLFLFLNPGGKPQNAFHKGIYIPPAVYTSVCLITPMAAL